MACLVGVDFGAKFMASFAKCFEVYSRSSFALISVLEITKVIIFICFLPRMSTIKKTISPCGILLFFYPIYAYLESVLGW